MEDIRDTLTDRQKEVLEEMLQAKKEEDREEAKAALRSTVAGSRKPEAFNPAVETLAQYLKRWKPFSKAIGLSDTSSIITLVTYLDTETQKTIEDKKLDSLQNWSKFEKQLLIAVEAPASRYKSRQMLLATQQEIGESTDTFIKRLREKAAEVHGTRLTPELNEIAKDFLIKGLRDRGLRKDVIKNSKWSFDEAIEYVRDMAATDKVLDLKKSSTDVEVNIMQVKKESPLAKQRTDRNWTDKRCYFCGIIGHIKKDCRRRRGTHPSNSASYRPNAGFSPRRPQNYAQRPVFEYTNYGNKMPHFLENNLMHSHYTQQPKQMNNHYVPAVVRPTYESPDRSGMRNWTSRQDSGKVYSVLPAVSEEVSTPVWSN